jgi:colicin import membrane protein
MMKKLFFTMLALVPLTLWAQDNTWEINEDEDVKQEVKVKTKVDPKYLKGAVPEVNGQVVFSKHINVPGKTASQIYDIMLQYMQRLTKTSNQIESQISTSDAQKHEIVGIYQEWLVFKNTALSLDRTRFFYALRAQCSDGAVDIEMMRIRYLYEEERTPQRMTAEEWITDKESVNKKNTKLMPMSGKFRRKTIDRKDFLFNKFESLLK